MYVGFSRDLLKLRIKRVYNKTPRGNPVGSVVIGGCS